MHKYVNRESEILDKSIKSNMCLALLVMIITRVRQCQSNDNNAYLIIFLFQMIHWNEYETAFWIEIRIWKGLEKLLFVFLCSTWNCVFLWLFVLLLNKLKHDWFQWIETNTQTFNYIIKSTTDDLLIFNFYSINCLTY